MSVNSMCSVHPETVDSVSTPQTPQYVLLISLQDRDSCQDEKSQLKNKDKALRVLRSRLYEMELAKQHDAEAEARRSQIGTGDRSEKIRTYNFPQGRVTDHRIKLTLHRLENILNGDLDEIIDSLIAADQAVS